MPHSNPNTHGNTNGNSNHNGITNGNGSGSLHLDEGSNAAPNANGAVRVASDRTPSPQAAAAAVRGLRGAVLPLQLEPALGVANRQVLAMEGGVPDQLVEVAIEVASENPALVGDHVDARALTEAYGYVVAMRPVASAARAVARQVDDEVIRRKAVIAGEALRLYKYLRAIAGTPRGAPIREPLDRMTKSMRKPGGKNKKNKKAPEPAAPEGDVK